MQVAMAQRALNGNRHCGDQGGCWQNDGKTTLCMIDGLGHGEHAEIAAKAALDYVARHRSEPLRDIFAGCDSAIRHTRGTAMGIAVVDEDAGKLTYAGVGNTRAMIVGKKTVRLRSSQGIVGGGYRTLSSETVPLEAGDLVVMFTDGLPEALDVSGYDGALRMDLPRLAQKILQDWRRKTDDAMVLVSRAGAV